jgi:Tfp pilus assembly protein PilO
MRKDEVENVDYKASQSTQNNIGSLHAWHKLLYIILVSIIFLGLIIFFIQSSQISDLQISRDSLQATNISLQATVEALERIITPTRAP